MMTTAAMIGLRYTARRASAPRATCFALLLLLLAAPLWAVEGSQLVVSIAPGWDSTKGTLQRFEREGRGWRAVGEAVPVLYGRSGLAWGRGVFGAGENGRQKAERDGRAPAGIFRIGKIYTYDRALPAGADYPFHTVTEGDAWPDDVAHPNYNQFIRVNPANPPAWYAKQRMKLGDFAYRWLVEIRHNADPPVPGAGSAIFFHLRRGADRPSAGCTVMAEADLVTLVRWLRAEKAPHYALFPAAEYEARRAALGLPAISR